MSAGSTLIVGGGLAGSSVALALAGTGASATVLDPGEADGSATPAAAGILAPGYEAAGTEEMLALGVRARAEWPSFASELERLGDGPVHLREDGLLLANRDDEEHEEAARVLAAHERVGSRAELLEPAAARDLQPALSPELRSCLWLPGTGHVDPAALARRLPSALRAAGVRTLAAGAREVRSRDGRVVGVTLVDGRELDAGRVVVAAGAWAGRLEGLPVPAPIRPVRGQMIRFARVPDGVQRIVADHGGRYVVPRHDGSALAGSTMEEAGFEPSVTPEGLDRIRRAAFRLIPGLREAEVTETWAGLRPLAPDDRPVLGADPRLEGLFWATGYGRNGILWGPFLGRQVARVILGDPPEVDVGPFRPDRFG